MTDLLIFGRTGQVALELARLAPDARFLGRDEADLANPAACAASILAARPAAVINAAAYTAELDANPKAVAELRRLAAQGPLVLLYAARDEQHNNAVVLRALAAASAPDARLAHHAWQAGDADALTDFARGRAEDAVAEGRPVTRPSQEAPKRRARR